MSSTDRAAWSDFWAQESGKASGGGCLPQGWAGIDQAQQQVWRGVAKQLRRSARVLDLATGDARVLRWLRAARADLKLTGVDAAPTLPPAPNGCKVRAGVAMEELPFGNASFDAVTSQFGFEYGDTPKVCAQIGRVLKPNGTASLLIHRGDGPILAHNLRRKAAIGWVLEDAGAMTRAMRGLRLSGAAAPAVVKMLAELAAEGASRFGDDSAAWEIAEAARRTVVLGMQQDPRSVVPTLRAIAAKADNEIGRIESLQNACRTADDRDLLAKQLAAAGLYIHSVQAVHEPSGRCFADLISITKQR